MHMQNAAPGSHTSPVASVILVEVVSGSPVRTSVVPVSPLLDESTPVVLVPVSPLSVADVVIGTVVGVGRVSDSRS